MKRLFALLLLLATGGMGCSLAADDPAQSPFAKITYTLAQDSKVSLAIYDEKGGIVRQLLLTAERKAGNNVELWNGLDDKGKPVPAAKYAWKLLSSQGLRAEWITSLGSGLTPGYQIMPGNHVGAITAVLDDSGDAYVMGGCSECVPGIAKINRAGKQLWNSGDLLESNNDCGCGLAAGKLYSLLGNAKIIAIDPATGHGLWKKTTDWNDVKDGWHPGRNIIQLAARGEQLVISNKDKNVIRWLNPADGEKVDEAPLTAPVALAFDGQGNVVAISGKNVVRLSRQEKTPKDLITDLTEPNRLAVDPASGEILVYDAGASEQIKRFSAEGKLLKTYGRAGGRLFGKYEPLDFRGVTSITADKEGGFVVVEASAAPRRTAFFDRDGKLVNEWYGGLYYANGGAGDPDDVSIVWYHSGSGEVVKSKVDYVNKRYSVLETYKLIGIGDGVIGTGNSMDAFVVRHFNGHTYLANMNIDPRIVMVDEANRQLVPVVGAKYWMMHDFTNPAYTPSVFVAAYYGGTMPKELKYGATDDAVNKEAVLWTDLNGDGKPQKEEMVFSKRMLQTHACGRIWFDSQMNMYEMNDRPMKWTPREWTKGGAPVYGGWADWKPIGEKPGWFDPIKVSWPAGSGVVPLNDGSLMAFFNNTENPFGKGIGSDGLGGNYIVKWDPTGKLVWCTGFHSADFGAAPGEGRFFWNIAGVAHNCVAVTDMQCYYTIKNLVHVWDADGLWVGRLLENPDLKAAPEEAYTLATENFGGTLLEVTEQNKAPGLYPGDVVFFGCGQNVTLVYKITGWDTFKRDHGAVEISVAQVELAKNEAFQYAAKRGSSGRTSKAKKYTASVLPRLPSAPALTGKIDDPVWRKAGVLDDFRVTPAEEDPETMPTRVLAGYDDQNLYLAVHCTEKAMDKLHMAGSPIHLDDSVELFIDRACNRSNYYQIIVNPAGIYYVGYGWAPKPDIKLTTKAFRDAEAWNVELAIPWKSLDATPPQPGEKLGFNVVRNRYAEKELHSNWSPLLGNMNHTPQKFGTLYVGDTLPRDAIALREGRAFIRNMNAAPLPLNGDLNKWRAVTPMKIMDGAKSVADLYLGWRDDGLYATFDVKTNRPWKNAAAFEMAFNGGACCDVQVGPVLEGQKDLIPGDVRFIAAPLGDAPAVVEFLPKLTTDLGEADKAPRKYHTDAQGDNMFDRIAKLPADAIFAKPKADGSGYIVEMRLPLRAPLKLKSGEHLKLDASVILSNPAGNRAELRLPLFSVSGDDMFVATDVIMETRLRPWNWGNAELE